MIRRELFLVLVAVLLSFKMQANEIKHFYTLGGPYKIGVTELFLTDSSRHEMFKRRQYKRLFLKVWYPADSLYGKQPLKYFQGQDKEEIIKMFASKGVTMAMFDSITQYNTYSAYDIPVSSAEAEFPIIFFNAGYYFGHIDLYTTYIENLVSHGFIVCGITHLYEQPYVRFPDGEEARLDKKKATLHFLQWLMVDKTQIRRPRTMEKQYKITRMYLIRLRRFTKSMRVWVKDTRFVIDYFENCNVANHGPSAVLASDMDNVATYGQSFGGAVAGQVCFVDDRVKAAVNMDCFQFGDLYLNKIDKPIMLIDTDYKKKWIQGNDVIYTGVTEYYHLHYPNSQHYLYTDAALLPYITDAQREDFIGPIDGYEATKQVNEYVAQFFSKYLKEGQAPLLEEPQMDQDFHFNIRKRQGHGNNFGKQLDD